MYDWAHVAPRKVNKVTHDQAQTKPEAETPKTEFSSSQRESALND